MNVLYHYCPPSVFHSIVDKRAIWLSSLSMSNDTMEGKLVPDLMAKIAKEDDLNPTLIVELKAALSFYEDFVDGLGICLSTEGDLLSQWRGYAGDATGFAIGFDAAYLSELALSFMGTQGQVVRVNEVIYDHADQVHLIRPIYDEFKKAFLESPLAASINWLALYASDEKRQDYETQMEAARRLLTKQLVGIMSPLFALKTPAFQEEHEWRMISYLFGHEDCSFRISGSKVVPYREFLLASLSRQPIINVILGPKNPTPPRVIEGFLKSRGFVGATVMRSESTYR